MSTRCQIGIFEKSKFIENEKLNKPEVLIYRHSDGYPENPGVLEPLTKFVKNFKAKRGFEVDYIGARLIPYLIFIHTEDLPNQETENIFDHTIRKEEFGGYLSYGIDKPGNFHGDIKFFYAVFIDRIEVYKTSLWKTQKPENFILIETVSLN